MSVPLENKNKRKQDLLADCKNCFGLCCVALPFAKSADFAFDKDSGNPCRHLQADYRCNIHQDLRSKGFRGCAVYECFGAGQKVSQVTFKGNDWREHPNISDEMFKVFPIVQQLHEMLYYLNQALQLEEAQPILQMVREAFEQTEHLTNLSPPSILALDISAHRAQISNLLLQTSELVRAKVANRSKKKLKRGMDWIGARLRGADLRGADLRGSLLIAADLRDADMRWIDLIGADLRDANLSGANLTGSIFLTQAQVNAAKGNRNTVLPDYLRTPDHWL
ncbi:MAG TPA: pentapeptide repeat-containing protein [Bacillus sp. (in: firmicutes)]|uniref:pentapeptide repeat-containing protein n=1 Tax=Bacillus litorisediminis TaxID=2922713 RepID=UPI001FAE06B5|nr:pentapeptide repeat-containing protein [Bacillus litorisediminis]HWO78647.1 pentapeptide repeat-containing protein [Bacillus sp. (in: firmicutes)]